MSYDKQAVADTLSPDGHGSGWPEDHSFFLTCIRVPLTVGTG